jgi:uncharacterized membrane protein YdjX (TVP38/TMEM64 family)
MSKKSSLGIKEIVGLFVIIILFVVVALLSSAYEPQIQNLLGRLGSLNALAFYILIDIASVVLAPLAALPLLPLAVTLWGPFAAAMATVVGDTIGAIIAYVITRKYGQNLARKVVSIEQGKKIKAALTGHNQFLSVFILRMTLPVDLLSYALGLFTEIPLKTYITATFLGVIPFNLVFAYASNTSVWYQIAAFALAGLFLWYGYRKVR